MVVVGVEPEWAPLDLLERIAVPDEQLGKVLAALGERANITETVVLSTCLRTEVYAVVDRFHDAVADLQELFAERAGLTVEAVAEHLTVQFDSQVADHLFEVAAGLRSAVLGETEVLGQVRRAAQRAAAERVAGPVLQELFRRAVQAGRRVRSATAIARGSLSLAHVASELVSEHLDGTAAGQRVVVVGAGEMGAAVAAALGRAGAEVVVANRTHGRARAAAAAVGGRGVGIDQLAVELAAADAVVTCSGASVPVIGPEMVEPLVARRQKEGRRHLVLVDLGMPRNIDPVLRGVAGVVLLDLGELRARADQAMASRRAEVGAAQAIVRAEVEKYRADQRARGAAPAVAALRERMESLRAEAVERQRHRYGELTEQQWAAVDAVSEDVMARLLHQPTVALKEAAGTARGERLVEAVRALFDL
ncbi:MAG: glutamyl-tRNA reductase [Actinomycetota bacterium]|jgi:glutamyl-tRNA reductase|nr:glutamyl-tRNA reductase [Actinomycetota bacterium]